MDPNRKSRLIRRLNSNPRNPHVRTHMPFWQIPLVNKHTHLCQRGDMCPQRIVVSLLHRNKGSVLKLHNLVVSSSLESLMITFYSLSLLAFSYILRWNYIQHTLLAFNWQARVNSWTWQELGGLPLGKKTNKIERGKESRSFFSNYRLL